MTESAYNTENRRVQIEEERSKEFEWKKGIKQGDSQIRHHPLIEKTYHYVLG